MSPLLVAPPQPTGLELLVGAPGNALEDHADPATVRRALAPQPLPDLDDEPKTRVIDAGCRAESSHADDEDEEPPTLVRACGAPTVRPPPAVPADAGELLVRGGSAEPFPAPDPPRRSVGFRYAVVLAGIASVGVAVGFVVGSLIEPKGEAKAASVPPSSPSMGTSTGMSAGATPDFAPTHPEPGAPEPIASGTAVAESAGASSVEPAPAQASAPVTSTKPRPTKPKPAKSQPAKSSFDDLDSPGF